MNIPRELILAAEVDRLEKELTKTVALARQHEVELGKLTPRGTRKRIEDLIAGRRAAEFQAAEWRTLAIAAGVDAEAAPPTPPDLAERIAMAAKDAKRNAMAAKDAKHNARVAGAERDLLAHEKANLFDALNHYRGALRVWRGEAEHWRDLALAAGVRPDAQPAPAPMRPGALGAFLYDGDLDFEAA
jgi:hypothetical protein